MQIHVVQSRQRRGSEAALRNGKETSPMYGKGGDGWGGKGSNSECYKSE